MPQYRQRGYLLEDYRLFHIKDNVTLDEIDYHYHEFHKILLFVSGTVSYAIEGRHYPLSPNDIVLVPRGCVHKPEAGIAVPYERLVLYLSPAFLREGAGCSDCDLELCFNAPVHVLHLENEPHIPRLFEELEKAVKGNEYGDRLLGQLIVKQIMITLCRVALSAPSESAGAIHDEKIVEILGYINDNLTQDISADTLAARFYISKYHMMRRFRAETGYSIHSYVINKRMLYARDLLHSGATATQACYSCGYKDYSSFARAYVRQFGVSPKGQFTG